MSDDDPIYFDQFSRLPGNLLSTAIQVMKFASNFLNVATTVFDWQGFLDAINAYRGSDLALSKYQNNSIHQQTATVEVMVNKIVDFLRSALSVVLTSTEIEALRANVEATFTNLETATDEGWASFSYNNIAQNSSYEYRVLFAFPNADLPDWFYSLVTTIKLTADIREQSSWWGLVSSSSKNFSAEITAMELIVQQGFVNPLMKSKLGRKRLAERGRDGNAYARVEVYGKKMGARP